MIPTAPPEHRGLVVVGAGAAGLFAATFAARAGADVLVLESSVNPGAKIRISGGGRCNMLPVRASLEDFWTNGSMTSLRNVVFAWPLADVRAHFERHLGIALADEEPGKVFPRSGSAREVSQVLLDDLRRAGAELRAGTRVQSIHRKDAGFLIDTSGGAITARRVVLATGGCSLPKTGSDGSGYRFAAGLGHSLHPLHPALVPLLAADASWGDLSGVSLAVQARAVRDGAVLEERRGDFLFTHRGFSGPVVLDLSRHFTSPKGGGTRLEVAWGAISAETWAEDWRGGGARHVKTALARRLPERLAERLLLHAGVDPAGKVATLGRDARARLLDQLTRAPLDVRGDEGYRVAEVTGGGVPLAEVRTRTLESRCCPGLHLAGEILDATGRLGGYNFLWAWVSGRLAGEGAARLLAAGPDGFRAPVDGD